MMKQHKGACADVCKDCDVKGNNITMCRQQLQHDDDNAICKKKVDCCEKLGLPQCCLNLANVHLELLMLCFKPREIKGTSCNWLHDPLQSG